MYRFTVMLVELTRCNPLKLYRNVEELLAKMRSKLTGNIRYKDHRVSIACSIGSAMIPGDTDNLDDAIKIAYKAMREDKEQRSG